VHAFNLLALVIPEHGIAKRYWCAEWSIGVVVHYGALPVVNGIDGLCVISSPTNSGSPESVSATRAANTRTLPVLVVRRLNIKSGVCWVKFKLTAA